MPKSGRNGVTIQDGAARSLRRGHGGGRGGLGNASETGGRRTDATRTGAGAHRIRIQTRGKRQALHDLDGDRSFSCAHKY